MHLLPSFLICASGPWALDWNLHYGLPWFSGFWIQAKLCHWLFCFSSLPKVSDGTFWPQWLHETIPIMNLNLSIYHACVCLSECLCVLNCLDFFFDPMDCNSPGSSVHGSLQARILQWVAMPSYWGSSWPRNQTQVSCIGKQNLYHWAPWKAPSTCLSVYLSLNLSI